MEKKYLSVSEAATLLGLNCVTVRQFVREGKIPHIRLGRKMLIPVSYFESLEQK